ncbi:nitroreductase family protein [Oligoflexia bacterium]|nr:nitroreductase family protein [Oligoflexia bacterium]
MDIFEAIAKRQSYRAAMKDEIVPHENLRRIVQCGLQAPSGKNMQTTSFVIIDRPDLVDAVTALHPSNKAMQQAKAFIACIIDKQPEAIYEGHAFQIEDCAAAVENMLLAITALGYATVWIDGWLRINNHAEKIRALIELPENKIVRIILPLGVPAETYEQPQKKPFEERAWFNQYHATHADATNTNKPA